MILVACVIFLAIVIVFRNEIKQLIGFGIFLLFLMWLWSEAKRAFQAVNWVDVERVAIMIAIMILLIAIGYKLASRLSDRKHIPGNEETDENNVKKL